MLHVNLTATEPADGSASTGAWSWLRGIVRSKASLDELERKVGEATLQQFAGVCGALEAAGFTDVIHVFVGDHQVFDDPVDRENDLAEALAVTLSEPARFVGVDELRLVTSFRSPALHVLGEVTLTRARKSGAARTAVRFEARDRSLSATSGESAVAFAQRIAAHVRRPEQPGAALDELDGVVRSFAEQLAHFRPSCETTVSSASAELVRGGRVQVGRFRHLGFGTAVRRPIYRLRHGISRGGAYDRPFQRYYFDPYEGLVHWLIIEAMLDDGVWDDPRVRVVDPAGHLLFTGADLAAGREATFEVGRGAVSMAPRLSVASSVPWVASLDPAERGSEHTPGWGGSGEGDG